MEKSLEVYIGHLNDHFSASIRKFHHFEYREKQITKLFSNIKEAISDHIVFCNLSRYQYPDALKGTYRISYKYSIYAMLALMPDLSLLSRETKIPHKTLLGYALYNIKPTGTTFKRILSAINNLGDRICALEKPDFALCSNLDLISEYSGISISTLNAYRKKDAEPDAENKTKLLLAMHQIGALYQSVVWA